ncbi:MAG: Uma2 family endonuclease [Candidatus Parabeggiatoa sp.]|nr:Uma2 family endonuclease [Candidatus Parabeggiatoa sp.]
MSELMDFEEEVVNNEVAKMGSLNHSLAAGQITGLLFNDDRFTVMPELSLDASNIDLKRFNLKAKDELVPDISVYIEPPLPPDKEVEDDILRVSQMPDLAIEVLSPRQAVGELVRKIKALFALGVKSCWLVIPPNESITIYSNPNVFKLFSTADTEAIDEIMEIRLPIQKVFRMRQS